MDRLSANRTKNEDRQRLTAGIWTLGRVDAEPSFFGSAYLSIAQSIGRICGGLYFW